MLPECSTWGLVAEMNGSKFEQFFFIRFCKQDYYYRLCYCISNTTTATTPTVCSYHKNFNGGVQLCFSIILPWLGKIWSKTYIAWGHSLLLIHCFAIFVNFAKIFLDKRTFSKIVNTFDTNHQFLSVLIKYVVPWLFFRRNIQPWLGKLVSYRFSEVSGVTAESGDLWSGASCATWHWGKCRDRAWIRYIATYKYLDESLDHNCDVWV